MRPDDRTTGRSHVAVLARSTGDASIRRRRRTSIGPRITRRRVTPLRGAPPHDDAPPVDRVVVAVPARNEAERIARCLTSIDRAAAHCAVPVTVVVAADTCHDETAHLARSVTLRHVTVSVVEGSWHGAGCARAMAIESALANDTGDLAALWIANTDADCEVDPTWLRLQLRDADVGAAAVAGIVTLDPGATPERLMAEFTATYHRAGPTHHHVHAANLGIRANAYRFAGGWSTRTVVGEDHKLWRRLTAAGLHVVAPTDVKVITSSRTTGRIPGGFASALSRLARHGGERELAAS